ncbi:MAG: hypothetical protein WD431_21125 [Cyclobacteriaceae bacterium]
MDIVIKNQMDYGKLFHIIYKGGQLNSVTIHLYNEFLSPSDILLLTQFIIVQLQRIGKVNLKVQEPRVKDYLRAIGLFEFCSTNYFESNEIKEISSHNAMPIRRVNRNTMNYYILKTQAFFQAFFKDKDLGMLDVTLSELINNVYDHSKSPIDSFVFSQFYPHLNEIKIAVSDLGNGIPRTVNSFLNNRGFAQLSQKEAVKWALKLNRTTESLPHNAGRGLDTICSFVRANKGSWILLSDQVKMHGTKKQNIFSQNPIDYFIGTVIEISIKVANLENQEIIDEIDWRF